MEVHLWIDDDWMLFNKITASYMYLHIFFSMTLVRICSAMAFGNILSGFTFCYCGYRYMGWIFIGFHPLPHSSNKWSENNDFSSNCGFISVLQLLLPGFIISIEHAGFSNIFLRTYFTPKILHTSEIDQITHTNNIKTAWNNLTQFSCTPSINTFPRHYASPISHISPILNILIEAPWKSTLRSS